MQDEPVGVKCRRKRGCLLSQALIAGVLWVDRLQGTDETARMAVPCGHTSCQRGEFCYLIHVWHESSSRHVTWRSAGMSANWEFRPRFPSTSLGRSCLAITAVDQLDELAQAMVA